MLRFLAMETVDSTFRTHSWDSPHRLPCFHSWTSYSRWTFTLNLFGTQRFTEVVSLITPCFLSYFGSRENQSSLNIYWDLTWSDQLLLLLPAITCITLGHHSWTWEDNPFLNTTVILLPQRPCLSHLYFSNIPFHAQMNGWPSLLQVFAPNPTFRWDSIISI